MICFWNADMLFLFFKYRFIIIIFVWNADYVIAIFILVTKLPSKVSFTKPTKEIKHVYS